MDLGSDDAPWKGDPKSVSRAAVLWSFARPRVGVLSFALLLGLLASVMDLASPLITRWVLDSLNEGGSLLGPVMLLVALLMAGVIISWWQRVILGALAEHVVFDARESMIRHFLQARVLPMLQRPAGELVTRVTSDSVLLREAASMSVVGLVNGSIMLVGTIVLMAVLDIVLVLATLASVLVIVVVFTLLMPAIALAQDKAQAALGELGGSLESTLRALKTVKAARAEERQVEQLLKHAEESRVQSLRAVRREALVWSVGWTGVQTSIIVILGVGAWRVSLGQMTMPTLVAFLLYAFGLLAPITQVSSNLATLQAGIAAAGRIREIGTIDVEPGRASVPAVNEDRSAPVIQLDGVTARYTPGSPAAVQKLNLVVPRYGHTAIVGPSGAGKTTVLSLILRFIEPEHGEIRMNGVPYAQLGTDRVRVALAYVEQETPTLPGTLRDNLTFANPDVSEEEMTSVLRRLRLDGLVANLPDGLDTRLGDATVSGGERQRIALARALLADPQVLLLDEATAQVDGISEAAIHEVIRDRAASSAVVTIAHRLSTVVDADGIVVMDGGHMVARGTHRSLLSESELYRRLVEALELNRTSVATIAEVADEEDSSIY